MITFGYVCFWFFEKTVTTFLHHQTKEIEKGEFAFLTILAQHMEDELLYLCTFCFMDQQAISFHVHSFSHMNYTMNVIAHKIRDICILSFRKYNIYLPLYVRPVSKWNKMVVVSHPTKWQNLVVCNLLRIETTFFLTNARESAVMNRLLTINRLCQVGFLKNTVTFGLFYLVVLRTFWLS